MNLLCDTLILVFIVLCALIGKKRGFIKTFFAFFGGLVSFVVSSVLANPFGDFLSRKLFFPSLRSYFIESMTKKANSLDLSSVPEEALRFLQKFNFSKEDLESFLANQVSSGTQEIEMLADTVIKPISDSVGHAVALILLFILCAVVIRILVKVLNLISKLPILNFSNQTLGLVSGILLGVLLSVVFSSALELASPILQGSENKFLSTFDFEKTYLVRLFSSFDFLRSLFLK